MSRPIALVAAPLRGEALNELHQIVDVVLEPWIEHTSIRLLSEEQLAVSDAPGSRPRNPTGRVG